MRLQKKPADEESMAIVPAGVWLPEDFVAKTDPTRPSLPFQNPKSHVRTHSTASTSEASRAAKRHRPGPIVSPEAGELHGGNPWSSSFPTSCHHLRRRPAPTWGFPDWT